MIRVLQGQEEPVKDSPSISGCSSAGQSVALFPIQVILEGMHDGESLRSLQDTVVRSIATVLNALDILSLDRLEISYL